MTGARSHEEITSGNPERWQCNAVMDHELLAVVDYIFPGMFVKCYVVSN